LLQKLSNSQQRGFITGLTKHWVRDDRRRKQRYNAVNFATFLSFFVDRSKLDRPRETTCIHTKSPTSTAKRIGFFAFSLSKRVYSTVLHTCTKNGLSSKGIVLPSRASHLTSTQLGSILVHSKKKNQRAPGSFTLGGSPPSLPIPQDTTVHTSHAFPLSLSLLVSFSLLVSLSLSHPLILVLRFPVFIPKRLQAGARLGRRGADAGLPIFVLLAHHLVHLDLGRRAFARFLGGAFFVLRPLFGQPAGLLFFRQLFRRGGAGSR